MQLTQQQLLEIRRRARERGISDQEIDAALPQVLSQFDKQTSGASDINVTPQAVSNTKSTATPPIQLSQPTMPEEQGGNFLSNIAKAVTDPAAKFGAFVGESVAQASRVGADALSGRQGIFGADDISKEVGQLALQDRQILALMKSEKDPEKKKALAQQSRDLNAKIDDLGNKAREIGSQKETFLMKDSEAIANRGEILKTGVKRTAGAAAYAVPGGVGVRGALKAGAVAGGLAGLGTSEGKSLEETKDDVLTGLVTGAAISGATAGVVKALRSNISSKAGTKLDDVGNEIKKSAYVKGIGQKPLKREGGAKLLDKMQKVGIVPGDADAIIAQADDIYRQDGGKVFEATKKLADKGAVIKVADLKAGLLEDLAKARSSTSKKPIQAVLEILDEDLAGKTTISPDELYLLKSEYGGLGKWNSLSSAVEKKQAESWQRVYMKANDLLDETLKNNGFTEFSEINQRLHTATQASQWATRVSEVAPNRYNIGLYDWISGLAGGAAFGGIGGGVAAVVGKKVMESGKAATITGRVTQRVGQALEKIKPMNVGVDQALVNTAITGANSLLSGPVADNQTNQANQTTEQQASNNLVDHNAPFPTNTDEIITQQPKSQHPIPKFREFSSKQEMISSAFADGLGTRDVQELVKLWDEFAPTDSELVPPEVLKLLEQRKALSGAGVNTKSIDDKLGQFGFEIGSGSLDTTKLSAPQLAQLADFETSSNMLNNLYEVLEEYKPKFGPIKGRIGAKNVYDTDSQAVQSIVKATAQVVGRAMEGGVLRKEDEIKYQAMLPQITDTPAVAKKKIDNVIKIIEEQRKIREQSFVRAGYSTSGGSNPSQEDVFMGLVQ